MSAFSARAAREDRPAQAGRGSCARGERDAEAGSISLFPISYRPNQRATATGFVTLVLPMLPPIAASLGTPFFGIITIPISIEVAMVMIGFVGVATFNKSGMGATSILQSIIWVSPKRKLRNATLAPSCSYYASCAAARGAAVGALGSQPVMTYRIPRHIGFSAHRSKYLGEEPYYVRLSGAEGEELSAALALCMGGIDLMQPPTPVRSLFTKAMAQKA